MYPFGVGGSPLALTGDSWMIVDCYSQFDVHSSFHCCPPEGLIFISCWAVTIQFCWSLINRLISFDVSAQCFLSSASAAVFARRSASRRTSSALTSAASLVFSETTCYCVTCDCCNAAFISEKSLTSRSTAASTFSEDLEMACTCMCDVSSCGWVGVYLVGG